MKEFQKIEVSLKNITAKLEICNCKLNTLLTVSEQNKGIDSNNKNLTEKYLSAKEVASFIGLSVRTVYRRYYEGKLKSFKMGGLRVFPLSEVMRFIEKETLSD